MFSPSFIHFVPIYAYGSFLVCCVFVKKWPKKDGGKVKNLEMDRSRRAREVISDRPSAHWWRNRCRNSASRARTVIFDRPSTREKLESWTEYLALGRYFSTESDTEKRFVQNLIKKEEKVDSWLLRLYKREDLADKSRVRTIQGKNKQRNKNSAKPFLFFSFLLVGI